MKSFKVAFICLIVCCFGLTVAGFTERCNPLLAELTDLPENEMVSAVGAFCGQKCSTTTTTCPGSVSCGSNSCKGVPDPAGGYGCATQGTWRGCAGSGSYYACVWASEWWCDADGGGDAGCGKLQYLTCTKNMTAGCDCKLVETGNCKDNCS